MSNNITQARYHKRTTFQQLSPPLVLTKPQGGFFPWKGHATRDAGNISIGEHAKQTAALNPDRLKVVLAAMNDVARRIEALEARRAAPQPTHDAPCACAGGTLFREPDDSAVLLQGNRSTFISPLHRRPSGEPDVFDITPPTATRDTKEKTMPTRPAGLAPNNHIEGRQAKMRSTLSFADRLRRHLTRDATNGVIFGE